MKTRNTYTIYTTKIEDSEGGVTNGKTLEEISADETDGKKLLGTPFGVNIGHCVYPGMKYCENFLDRVQWYRVVEPQDPVARAVNEVQPSISVEFYEEGRS